jgi:hypothetical protein
VPLLIFSMMESPGAPKEQWQVVVHLVMAVSGSCYFVGGAVWLIWKSWSLGATALLVLPVSLVFLFVGANIGPVSLVLLNRWLLGFRAKPEHHPN